MKDSEVILRLFKPKHFSKPLKIELRNVLVFFVCFLVCLVCLFNFLLFVSLSFWLKKSQIMET